jgi:hypothetical protein
MPDRHASNVIALRPAADDRPTPRTRPLSLARRARSSPRSNPTAESDPDRSFLTQQLPIGARPGSARGLRRMRCQAGASGPPVSLLSPSRVNDLRFGDGLGCPSPNRKYPRRPAWLFGCGGRVAIWWGGAAPAGRMSSRLRAKGALQRFDRQSPRQRADGSGSMSCVHSTQGFSIRLLVAGRA